MPPPLLQQTQRALPTSKVKESKDLSKTCSKDRLYHLHQGLPRTKEVRTWEYRSSPLYQTETLHRVLIIQKMINAPRRHVISPQGMYRNVAEGTGILLLISVAKWSWDATRQRRLEPQVSRDEEGRRRPKDHSEQSAPANQLRNNRLLLYKVDPQLMSPAQLRLSELQGKITRLPIGSW